MKFKSTGWEITGASGISAKIGTPVANVEIGSSYIRLPIEKVNSKQRIMLKGFGVGVGAGLSISTPVITVSGSLDQFPADGIGKIIEGPNSTNKTFRASDFFGEIMIFSLSAGKEVSGQLSGVLWLKEPIESCMLRLNCSSQELKQIARKTLLKTAGVAIPPIGIANSINELYKRTKCGGCFASMNIESQLVGAGVDVFSYRVNA